MAHGSSGRLADREGRPPIDAYSPSSTARFPRWSTDTRLYASGKPHHVRDAPAARGRSHPSFSHVARTLVQRLATVAGDRPAPRNRRVRHSLVTPFRHFVTRTAWPSPASHRTTRCSPARPDPASRAYASRHRPATPPRHSALRRARRPAPIAGAAVVTHRISQCRVGGDPAISHPRAQSDRVFRSGQRRRRRGRLPRGVRGHGAAGDRAAG
jgi:hypothetical protein